MATSRAIGVDRARVGIAALLLSTLLFPISDMLAKALSASHSALEIAWMRYAVLLAAVVPVLLRRPSAMRTTRPGLQVASGASAAGATVFALAGFVYLPVADATAIAFCAPMIVTGLAAIVLKERVGAVSWAAAAVGFVGVLVIVQPGGTGFQLASILPFLSSICSALTIVLTRVGRSERIDTTLVISTLVGFALLSVPVGFDWQTPSRADLMVGLVMGALAAAATMLQIFAYRCAPASLLAPFSYAQIVFAIAVGCVMTRGVPSLTTLGGAVVVIASGAAAGWRPSRSRRRRVDWRIVRGELVRLQPSARISR